MARNQAIAFSVNGVSTPVGNDPLPPSLAWVAERAEYHDDTLGSFPATKANVGQLIPPHTVPVDGSTKVSAREGRWLALEALVRRESVPADDLAKLETAADKGDTATVDRYLEEHLKKVTLTADDKYEVALEGADLEAFIQNGSLIRSKAPNGTSIPDGFHDPKDPARIPVGTMLTFRNTGAPLPDEGLDVWRIVGANFETK